MSAELYLLPMAKPGVYTRLLSDGTPKIQVIDYAEPKEGQKDAAAIDVTGRDFKVLRLLFGYVLITTWPEADR